MALNSTRNWPYYNFLKFDPNNIFKFKGSHEKVSRFSPSPTGPTFIWWYCMMWLPIFEFSLIYLEWIFYIGMLLVEANLTIFPDI